MVDEIHFKNIIKASDDTKQSVSTLGVHEIVMKVEEVEKKFNQSNLNGFDISTWCGAHAVELKMYMKLKSQQIVMMTEGTRWMGRIIKLFFPVARGKYI